MEDDAAEILIRHITDQALKAITPEEMANVLIGHGAITTYTDGDGVIMRYVEPWERT